MQRNANMLKNLKKCIFADCISFFAEMQSPVCPPRTNFCPSVKHFNILYIKRLQDYKWALKKYFASENRLPNHNFVLFQTLCQQTRMPNFDIRYLTVASATFIINTLSKILWIK